MPADQVWTPTPATVVASRIEHYRSWLAETGIAEAASYQELLAWSVADPDAFWASLWDFFEVPGDRGRLVLADAGMPGAVWFPDARLNYAEQALRHGADDAVAILARCEPGGPAPRDLTWGQLRHQVAALADTLTRLGVTEGDRVVGYLPNCAEAVVAFLASAAIGATWAGCGQDYPAQAAVDRLGQLRPRVLITADGYRYGGRDHPRLAEVALIRDQLDTVTATIVVARLGQAARPGGDHPGIAGTTLGWDEAVAGDHLLQPRRVAFDHPLWVLFSSGTTGRPKGLVHGHGGVVLEHLKQIALHCDLSEGDVFWWYTSPSWMMWNYQVAGLLVGATIVCYDGSPGYPDPDTLWALAGELKVAVLGTSPAYLQACERAGCQPGRVHDLQGLRSIGVTGSVLPPASYHWVADAVGSHLAVAAISGGTDVVSAFVGGVPTVPVWAGELSVVCLGTALQAWDEDGHPVVGQVGELVITRPLPSMPVRFWNDPDGSRYRDAYYDRYPGVWRHGDWITITDHDSVIIHGRSDSTLNRNGIRMGSADIYAAVEALPQVAEALVVGVEYPDGRYWMPLFVALAEGIELTGQVRDQITTAIRTKASPRHVPDDVIAVPAIPHTRTGKKLEIPVKRLLRGAAVAEVVDPKSVDDPQALAEFSRFARPD